MQVLPEDVHALAQCRAVIYTPVSLWLWPNQLCNGRRFLFEPKHLRRVASLRSSCRAKEQQNQQQQ
jgi:hypothetical protein